MAQIALLQAEKPSYVFEKHKIFFSIFQTFTFTCTLQIQLKRLNSSLKNIKEVSTVIMIVIFIWHILYYSISNCFQVYDAFELTF